MRIAIIADPLDNQHAGVHVFTREMVDAMIRTNPGHELILIREKEEQGLQGAEQISIRNTRLPIGFASLRLFFIIPWILHRKKVDVVIEPAHFGPFNLIKRIKRITIIHDLTPVLFPELHRWHSQVLQNIFLKGILNRTDLILANSNHTAADICKVYPQNCNKVKRIHPGVREIFKPEENSIVLENYKIQKSYFLFVGTIEPRKNLLTLLEAFRVFKTKSDSSFTLVIAGGNGWKSESFFEKLKDHPFRNDILCLGYVELSELPALYTQAVALIYPSLYEGFGLPIIEAMSCGTPVICADNSSLPEAGGDVAFYFDASDPVALSEQMIRVAGDPNLKKRMQLSMQEHVQRFDWNNFAAEFWNSIKELR
ncbi:MAG: glycosyltransferase family 4 protein [Bacteroidia bacterium]|nr:glycosyltransferase family 4 protein [Bacteroidia bacterium]